MQVIIENNCEINENYIKFIEVFVKQLIVKCDINTLEMFVIASDDTQEFGKTIIEYSQKLGKVDVDLDRGNYDVLGKNLTGFINGDLRQIVVVRKLAIEMLFSALTEVDKRTVDESNEELITIGGQIVLHEIGHVYDNEQRLKNNCYLEEKQEYNLSEEYGRYLLDTSSALYEEYRAELFASQSLQRADLLKKKKAYLEECIRDRLENYANIEERAYRIVYLFMHYLAHCKKAEERIDEGLKNDIQKEYIEILEELCDEVKTLDEKYPKLEIKIDFNNFSVIYSKIINLVSNETN